MKKAIFQNALQGQDAFLNATQIERYSIAQGNGPLDFDAYVGLVQKVATQYDHPKHSYLRAVKLHEAHYDKEHYDTFEDDNEPYLC